MSVPLQIRVSKPNTFKRYYEFFKGEALVAVLEYERKWYSGDAIIKINGQQWKLKTGGFWKRWIEVSAEQSPYSKHRIEYNWNYKLSFSPNNRDTYKLSGKGFWHRTWVWSDQKDQPLIETKSNGFSKQKRGEISTSLPESTDTYLVMVLGWYQVMTQEEHTAAAA